MKSNYVVFKRTTLIFIFCFFLVSLGTTISSQKVYAVADFGTAAVLPVGRHQTTLRFGNVSGIQDKFNDSGILQSPSRMNQRFDNKFLMKNPEFQRLAKALDEQLLPNEKPSSEIDLGSLEFNGNAQVDYFVPQIARGITSNWSLGIAIPIVRYRSDIQVTNAGYNNAGDILEGATSTERLSAINKELGAGAAVLTAGPKALFKGQLQREGYQTISERNEQFMGDMVLGSSLKLYDTRYVDFYMLNQLTLPTGPKDNPDDLVDLNIFGKTNFQTTLYTNYNVSRWLELGLGLSYTWGITDDIVKRVPRSEEDMLPPESTKENLRKDPGDSVGIQMAAMVRLSDYFHTGVGYEVNYKESDRYYGNSTARYDLLSKNSDSEHGIAKFKLTYSTLDGFFQGVEKIPYSVTYAFADSVHGKNIEREMTHELLLKFYF